MMNTHEHTEAPPEYPYLKMATRVSFFPLACRTDLRSSHFDLETDSLTPLYRCAISLQSPRFPWGEEDLIGTSHDKHARELADKE